VNDNEKQVESINNFNNMPNSVIAGCMSVDEDPI
jgi:hypothetical protein